MMGVNSFSSQLAVNISEASQADQGELAITHSALGYLSRVRGHSWGEEAAGVGLRNGEGLQQT